MSGLSFAALDFETANASRASVCQVGLSLVRDGQVTLSRSWLVTPPAGHDEFNPINTGVHGITRAHVVGSPTWDQVLPSLTDLVGTLPVFAHAAAFERSVLVSASAASGAPHPPWGVHCSLTLARRLLPDVPNHKLPTLASHFGVPVQRHHDAGDDARVCAQVVLGLAATLGADSMDALLDAPGAQGAATAVPAMVGAEWDGVRDDGVLEGQSIVFTGTLSTLTRAQAQEVARRAGAKTSGSVSRRTSILVVGGPVRPLPTDSGWPAKVREAFRLQEGGSMIQVWSEAQFVHAARTGVPPLS